MSMQLKNYIKFDELNPTKKDRKKYAAKKGCSNSDNECSAKAVINEDQETTRNYYVKILKIWKAVIERYETLVKPNLITLWKDVRS